jgi:hypothetical protein
LLPFGKTFLNIIKREARHSLLDRRRNEDSLEEIQVDPVEKSRAIQAIN